MSQLNIAYTDGACKGNGKQGVSAGGWGVYLQYFNGDERHLWGGEPDTTNNRMELMAAITALEATPAQIPLQLWTDSGYVKDGITQWIGGWKSRGWKKADGKPVLNQDLWQRLDQLTQNRIIDWQWIKGHAGHAGNEMADQLANKGVDSFGDELSPNPIAQNGENFMVDTPKPERHYTHNTIQNPNYTGDTQSADSEFWPILPKPINRGNPKRQLIFDTETTGMYELDGDRIVEIGVVELIDRKYTGNVLHVYLNPQRPMSDKVMSIHGISNEFAAQQPTFAEVAQFIYEFMVDSQVIAHNAEFDMRFLKAEFDRVGLTDFSNRVQVIDTYVIAKQNFPNQKNSLDALVKRLGVGQKDRTFHGALLDSEILAEVYLAMTGGQMDLAEPLAPYDQSLSGSPYPPHDEMASVEPAERTQAPKIGEYNTIQNPAYDGDTSRANPDFWPILPKPDNRGAPERQLIMDTETTGFDEVGGDRIVEVGIVELVGRKFTGNILHVYINPEKPMDDEVIQVHGISNEFVADKPKFAEVAQQIYDFMAGSEVIAHNATFDMKFLNMEFNRAGLSNFAASVQVTDTLALAKQMYPGQKNSLDALVKRLGVGQKDRTFHGALLDSEILAEVYLAMTGGQIAMAIDDDDTAGGDTHAGGSKFHDLSQYADLLTLSRSDIEADAAWRAKVLS
ncbi:MULTISPECIES: DNA polymerase III subunit epsilon [Moraxella]|uniref:Ribonuclease H n=1 Tax=Moraxella catarrhalis TaxID=480 RepID=A0A7Z1A3C5_MORCA|nr:Ribonuclease HI [Moraxella catarrhalis]STY81818.1 DNA polymerase III subunit epsilon [Moraxella catarrhalis]